MATTEQHESVRRPSLFGASRPKERRKAIGRLGPWQLVNQLGEGAMTRVYLARPIDRPECRPVYAVKTLRKEWWHDPRAIDAQRREAWVGARVSHPNVAPVLAAHVASPPFFLAMPRIQGDTLAERLSAGKRPPLALALWIARQACEGLAAIDAAVGMIHGDVKPANLIVGTDGHTTLIDLGFCQSPRDSVGWASRAVVGTLRYLAPERVVSTAATDLRSDLYSLGATLYETLTGVPPLDSDDPAELIAMHRQAKPVCVRELRPDLPKPVASLVHRLLAKEPLRRPSSHREVIDELVRLEILCFQASA
ncbi:Serine/threonine-protein kinase PrkC [Pseudobythopirellula maris]|uniref:Serine/threonine-protein kinase PrkC n=1 Tax=Pseudobythopirellula maris TaxID=2527991 RepID=A0A5C5ZJ05_9BACT|nr:serine/threonine-protein kinase [Pseudobythopirellula maris]TWT87372.1 Serine/threonine-protein kinase PrkC [Pseudobythopirellula maris]